MCRYGYNGVCASLPLDGVSDRDYESHVTKYHVHQLSKGAAAAEQQWSVFSSAQNLPAVLNDPSRGKQTNLFTKKWGDAFVEKTSIPPSAHLAHIDYDDFEVYMKKIGRRYRRHIRLNQTVTDHQQQQGIDENGAGAAASLTKSPSSSTSSLLSAASSQHNKQPQQQQLLANKSYCELNASNLNDIPQIFLKPTLELNNAATFAQVFPGLGGGGDDASVDAGDDREKQSGRLLQEKLSHYLDIVEVQIAKQVN